MTIKNTKRSVVLAMMFFAGLAASSSSNASIDPYIKPFKPFVYYLADYYASKKLEKPIESTSLNIPFIGDIYHHAIYAKKYFRWGTVSVTETVVGSPSLFLISALTTGKKAPSLAKVEFTVEF